MGACIVHHIMPAGKITDKIWLPFTCLPSYQYANYLPSRCCCRPGSTISEAERVLPALERVPRAQVGGLQPVVPQAAWQAWPEGQESVVPEADVPEQVEPVVPEVDVPRPAEEEPQVAPRTLAGGPVVVELQAWPRVSTVWPEPAMLASPMALLFRVVRV